MFKRLEDAMYQAGLCLLLIMDSCTNPDVQPCSTGIPRTYVLGRFDPWGCFHAFGETFRCTYDEAIKMCKENNENRDAWLRLGVHRYPVLSQVPLPPALETLNIRCCSQDDSDTIKSCVDIAGRCLLEHGFKIKPSRLSEDFLALAIGSSPVSCSPIVEPASCNPHCPLRKCAFA